MTDSVDSANGTLAPPAADTTVEVAFTLEEARLLRAVAQLGMRTAGGDGGNGGTPQTQHALDKLVAVIEGAERVTAIRSTLEQAGFETQRLSDADVAALASRLAGIEGVAG
jgi:hypothetical protein